MRKPSTASLRLPLGGRLELPELLKDLANGAKLLEHSITNKCKSSSQTIAVDEVKVSKIQTW